MFARSVNQFVGRGAKVCGVCSKRRHDDPFGVDPLPADHVVGRLLGYGEYAGGSAHAGAGDVAKTPAILRCEMVWVSNECGIMDSHKSRDRQIHRYRMRGKKNYVQSIPKLPPVPKQPPWQVKASPRSLALDI